jgi:ABC-type multidrug transport system fused ATPase/permease subunit
LLGIGLVLPFLEILTRSEDNLGYSQYFKIINIEIISNEQLILYSILFLLSIFTLKAIFLTFVSYKQSQFLLDLKTEVTDKLFRIYLKKPYSFHLKNNSAQLIRNLNDSTQIMVMSRGALMLLTEIVVLIGVFVLLLLIKPILTLATITSLGVLGFVFHKNIQTKASKWGEDRKYHEGYKMMHLQQGFGAVKEIKISGKEETFINYFSDHNKSSNSSQFKQDFVLSLPRVWFEWLTMLAMLIILFVLLKFDRNLSVVIPVLGLFVAAAFRLVPSVTRIMNSMQLIRFSYPSVVPYLDEFNSDKVNSNINKRVEDKITFKNKIEFREIGFKFQNSNEEVFSKINLELQKGSFIGLIGESGVGKTTLLNLFLGLLDPSSGEILVDGKNINRGLRNWQKLIGFVPQNIYLSDDTLRKNIAFGVEEKNIDEKKIVNCLKISRLYDFVNKLKDGINIKAGELGDRFSGGQKQRVGIARAFYYDPDILIFDEFTSSLDAETEKKIIDEVSSLQGKKTIVMISHSSSALYKCEKIYKLNKNILKMQNKNNQIKI